MPREGYKSLTINDETHAQLKHIYNKKKPELKKKGITTLGGYVTLLLEAALESIDSQEE